ATVGSIKLGRLTGLPLNILEVRHGTLTVSDSLAVDGRGVFTLGGGYGEGQASTVGGIIVNYGLLLFKDSSYSDIQVENYGEFSFFCGDTKVDGLITSYEGSFTNFLSSYPGGVQLSGGLINHGIASFESNNDTLQVTVSVAFENHGSLTFGFAYGSYGEVFITGGSAVLTNYGSLLTGNNPRLETIDNHNLIIFGGNPEFSYLTNRPGGKVTAGAVTLNITNDLHNGGLIELEGTTLTSTTGSFYNYGTLSLAKGTDDSPCTLAVNFQTDIGTLHCVDDAVIGRDLAVHGNYRECEFTVDSGAVLTFVGDSLVNNGNLIGTGLIDVTGLEFVNNGTISPNDSTHLFTVEGDLDLANSGVIEISVSGPVALADHDQLFITGELDLSGSSPGLSLVYPSPFVPSLADTFTVVQYASLSGDFGRYGGCTPGDIHLESVAEPTYYQMFGITGCCAGSAGNISDDDWDSVDISDLTALVNHLFVTYEILDCPKEANTTGDAGGNIDISDLTKLVNHLFVTFESLASCQ
ncbi:MAG: hypothetical protein V3T31_10600, partial [candidate division Zixibacteria bacterium]